MTGHAITDTEALRRRAPAIWNTDWLLLRGLAVQLDRMLGRIGSGSVLDFGCGTQPYRDLAVSHGLRYRGADFGTDAEVAIAPDGTLPPDLEPVDIVMSMQVLEHVGDLDLYFSEIARVLDDDGVLLLSTHGTWLYHPHPQDFRRWTRPGLQRDIETRGFVVEDIVSIVGPLATTTMIRLTSFAWALRQVPVVGRAFANILAVVMNLRALLEDRFTRRVKGRNGCFYLVRCRKARAR